MKKLISVFGSTGHQGSGVVKALLKDGEFKVRAFTRDTESEKSKKLKEMGAEVVKCSEADSKDEIEKAISSSYGVYLVTNSQGYMDKEIEYGVKVADVALSVGVKHFIYSTLPDSNKISNGKYPVRDFDNKANVEYHIRELSKNNPSFISTFIVPPFYYQNFEEYFGKPKKEAGEIVYKFSYIQDPNSKYKLDYGDVEEIGNVVKEVFKQPISKYSGISIPVTGEILSAQEIVDIFSKVTGKKVVYDFIPPSEFRKIDQDFANIMEFCNNCDYSIGLDKSIARSLTKLSTFQEYLIKTNFKLDD